MTMSNEVKTPKTKKRRIWTYGHRPFVVGGAVNYVLACDVECTGPHKLGKGYSGFLATSPNGKTFVSEATTGAIVGDTLESVRNDIATASAKIMRDQVKNAAKEALTAEVKDAKFFWSALKAS